MSPHMEQVLSWGRHGIRFGLGHPSYSDGSFLWALTRRASKQPVSTSPRAPTACTPSSRAWLTLLATLVHPLPFLPLVPDI